MSKSSFRCPFCGSEHEFNVTICPKEKEEIPAVYKLKGRILEGKYEVLDIIGEGGMGVVYEGRHTLIGRKIAIKFLYLPARASREMLSRFQSEARIAASISHKNIVEIIDMGVTKDKNGIHYIVMEYLEGHSLDEMLELAPVPETTAIKIVTEILSALNAVHSKRITHRDIKPDNVFLMEQAGGEQLVKILDFGISHLAHSPKGAELHTTKTGMVFGTPRYMSPEQARGSKNVDRRSDLYSVGVILYQMLTGKHPFNADNYNELILAITSSPPDPPSVHNPNISLEIEKIVLKALDKDPNNRFQTAAEFAAYLNLFKPHVDGEEMPSVITHLPADILERIRSGASAAGLLDFSSATPMQKKSRKGPVIRSPGGVASYPNEIATDMTLPTTPASGYGMAAVSTPPRVITRPVPVKRTKWAIAVPVVSLLLLAPVIGLGVYFLMKRGATTAAESESASMSSNASSPVQQPGTEKRKLIVTLEGLPKGAVVYVDDVIHPENPLLLKQTAHARQIRIEAREYKPWEKLVAVESDILLSVEMDHLVQDEEASIKKAKAPQSGKSQKKKVKRSSEKKQEKGEEAGEEKKKMKIDTVFPGLQKKEL